MHSYSCIYFLTGSSVMVTVVHVSHGLASEQPQRVTLGPASDWTRDLSGCLGHKPDIKSLDMHSQTDGLLASACLSTHLLVPTMEEWQSVNSCCEKWFIDVSSC